MNNDKFEAKLLKEILAYKNDLEQLQKLINKELKSIESIDTKEDLDNFIQSYSLETQCKMLIQSNSRVALALQIREELE
jgi:hypothetical protein